MSARGGAFQSAAPGASSATVSVVVEKLPSASVTLDEYVRTMAQVARDAELRATIEHYLRYLTATWESVPLEAQEWHDWDEDSRLVYELNWAVPEDRLHNLRQWANQGLLTSKERARYDHLLRLVERHRPLLDELLREDGARKNQREETDGEQPIE